MSHKYLEELCDLATEAHTRFQQEVADIDPIVGVRQSMRDIGIPVDVMTIDCLKSGKRIIVILDDNQPELVRYQFAWRDKDPEDTFNEMIFADLTADKMLDWMKEYF